MDLSTHVELVQRQLFAHLPHMGLPMVKKKIQIRQHLGQTLQNSNLWNRRMDLYHLKFYGIV